MPYGPIPPRGLPKQDQEKILMLASHWQRAAAAHATWAEKAKECVDFFEGRQWDEETLKKLSAQKRPALTFNKTAALVRLILGYHRNNRTDVRYLPGQDSLASEQVAEVLTRIAKQISEANHLPFVDTEVFLDGIVSARGFYDARLDFQNNDLGETVIRALDPFATYLDPDADSYDPASWSRVVCSRMASEDEIETYYGKAAKEAVQPFMLGQTPTGPLSFTNAGNEEITPVRRFGLFEDSIDEWWDSMYAMLGQFVDPLRKSIRLLDFQYHVTERKPVFIDLETGDKKPVPDHWKKEQVAKALYHAERIGNPLVVDVRPVKRVRWTTMAGDVLLYDDWSPYSTFTVVPFFPYFRRGVTRGMVEDMIDPQRYHNKFKSALIDTVMRTAHSGWKFHENSLDPKQEADLKAHGGGPGFNLKWKGQPGLEPTKIEPSGHPQSLDRVAQESQDDLRQITGINESALGELDRVQSGRAIEARQRQAVISVQVYMDNFTRSKELLGGKLLELVQEHYTEPRVFRILGEDGKFVQDQINQTMVDPETGATKRMYDVTVGKYAVAIDEKPMSASHASAQFEEMLLLLGKLGPVGQMAMQLRPDIVLETSSLPRKEELAEAIKQALGLVQAQQQAALAPPAPGQPAQQGVALDHAGTEQGSVQVQPVGLPQ